MRLPSNRQAGMRSGPVALSRRAGSGGGRRPPAGQEAVADLCTGAPCAASGSPHGRHGWAARPAPPPRPPPPPGGPHPPQLAPQRPLRLRLRSGRRAYPCRAAAAASWPPLQRRPKVRRQHLHVPVDAGPGPQACRPARRAIPPALQRAPLRAAAAAAVAIAVGGVRGVRGR